MKIGIPKEIKNHEYRVGLVPSSVRELATAGHDVLVERSAGRGIGVTDADYEAAGAVIVDSAAEAWSADMVIKVKEPILSEFDFLRPGLDAVAYVKDHL